MGSDPFRIMGRQAPSSGNNTYRAMVEPIRAVFVSGAIILSSQFVVLLEREGGQAMNSVPHRRQYPRYQVVFSTKCTAKGGAFRDLVRDVGAGGVFISTKRKIKRGRRINVQFPIFAFEKRLSLIGTVVRCEPEGVAVMFDEAIDAKIFKDGRFPGNVNTDNRSITKIDKHSID
jgi:hypothetical protein